MPEKKTDLSAVDALLARVRDERESHLKNWGVQTHPSYFGESERRSYERRANLYKEIWDAQKSTDSITWATVLLEEVYEALSEIDPAKRQYELVQVAAVALAEAESIDLRGGQLTPENPDGPVEIDGDDGEGDLVAVSE
jgi:hypothetical protein